MREGLRRYLTGSVPISIGLHLLALFLVFVIPLTANIVLPIVTVELPEYVRIAPLPPPPEVAAPAPPRTAEVAPVSSAAPTSAPPTIEEERLSPPYVAAGPPDLTSGIPSTGPGIGTTLDAPRVILPPPVQKPAGPVRVADLPVPPRKTVDVRPIYPEIARQAKKEGTVVIEAVLDTTGRVTQARVIQSVPLLDQAALDAVRQWRYTPTTLGGHPVSVLMTITIRFTLQ
ncbi:MAG TPA: energy transducer TonB [Vicinamibacterales bacterium]|nr:energy transducer TonB [Vicinamibacterales bacterium]